jgi:hypothetical protein
MAQCPDAHRHERKTVPPRRLIDHAHFFFLSAQSRQYR